MSISELMDNMSKDMETVFHVITMSYMFHTITFFIWYCFSSKFGYASLELAKLVLPATLGLMASLASPPVFGDFKHLVLFYNMWDDKQTKRKTNKGKGNKLLA